MRFATCDQISDLFFGGGARSNCQRRLTMLHEHGFLDKLRPRRVNESDVYCLTRNSAAGLRLLRSRSATRDPLRRAHQAPQLEHMLAINDVRCRLTRAAAARGAELAGWRGQGEMAWLGGVTGFIPDGFFLLQRRLEAGVLVSACFLEVERSPRGPRSVLRKYGRLRDYYLNGGYDRDFHQRSLRILVVTSHASADAEARWAAVLRDTAEKAGLSFAWFASLRSLLALDPQEVFHAAIWLRPGKDAHEALGELTPSDKNSRG